MKNKNKNNNSISNLIFNNKRLSRVFKWKKKNALLYIKNKAISINRKNSISYPNFKLNPGLISGGEKLFIKNQPTKLSQDLFGLTKLKNRSIYSQRKTIINLPRKKTFYLKQKRRLNFFQKNVKNKKNLKVFYSLSQKNLEKPKNIEKRLDVILVRLGYCNHIEQARQLIIKGVIFVDNERIINKNYMIKVGSTVETRYSESPFLLLYRYHLEHYPKTWNKINLLPASKNKKDGLFDKKLKKKYPLLDLGDNKFLTTKLGRKKSERKKQDIRFKLKKCLKWKKGAWKKTIREKPFRYPITSLPMQFIKLNINKTLITNIWKNKDITVPYSISNIRG